MKFFDFSRKVTETVAIFRSVANVAAVATLILLLVVYTSRNTVFSASASGRFTAAQAA
jgi:hypothetical protein